VRMPFKALYLMRKNSGHVWTLESNDIVGKMFPHRSDGFSRSTSMIAEGPQTVPGARYFPQD